MSSSSEYSLIEHLAKIAGGAQWRTVRMAMFSAYFDASGDIHGAEALALAGFAASADTWIEWEKEWLACLAEDGLTEFHRNELNSPSKWPACRLEKLTNDLSTVILNHGLHRFGVVIINRDLNESMSHKDRKAWHINSFSYAGRCAAMEMRQWTHSWGGRFPEMIFERGDTGSGRLTDLLRKDGYPAPQFRPKRDKLHKKTGILEKACVPLQAADLYAYELFSRARDIANGKNVSLNFGSGINPAIEKLSGRCGVAPPDVIISLAGMVP